MIPCPVDINHFWKEYHVGEEDQRSLRSLEEESKKWRSYEGGPQAWWWRKYVGDVMDEYIKENMDGGRTVEAATEDALVKMQNRLDKILNTNKARRKNLMGEECSGTGLSGRPNAVPWRALATEISEEPGRRRGASYGGKCGQCNKRLESKNAQMKCSCDGGPSPNRTKVREVKRSEVRNEKRRQL